MFCSTGFGDGLGVGYVATAGLAFNDSSSFKCIGGNCTGTDENRKPAERTLGSPIVYADLSSGDIDLPIVR